MILWVGWVVFIKLYRMSAHDGHSIEKQVPVYDFTTHSRAPETVTLYGAKVIICEGILAFHAKELCDLMDLKVFEAHRHLF